MGNFTSEEMKQKLKGWTSRPVLCMDEMSQLVNGLSVLMDKKKD